MKKTFKNSALRKCSIKRLIKTIPFVVFLFITVLIRVQAQTVTDFEGNVYNTVTIGTQVWTVENLKSTKYNDGTAIPNITINTSWTALTTGAYCDYSNTPANSTTYGRLYNWYAVDNNATTKIASNGGKNICPTDWHVPTDAEWTTLTTYLGGGNVAGGKLKEAGTTHWDTPNTGATNETGFTALPGGERETTGMYYIMSYNGLWWSSTEQSMADAWGRAMYTDFPFVASNFVNKQYGYSVRCLRDLSTDIKNPSASVIAIYPNPVTSILNIEYKNEDFETVSIRNSQGVLMTREKAIAPRQQLDFSNYVPGLYFLEFAKATGEISREKVVKH